MMRLELIEGLRIIIIALLSYLPTIAFSGWFEAWVAKKSGDDIPEQLGFLTIDPIVHFNVIGFATLLIGQLFGDYLPFFKDLPGWGRYIPLNPAGFSRARVIIQFCARAVAHFMLLLIAFFGLTILIKSSLLQGSVPADQIQTTSAFIQALSSVILFFYRQNFILCIIYSVIGLFRAFLFSYFPDFHLFSTKHLLFAFGILIAFVFVGSALFEILLSHIMLILAHIFMK